MAELADLLSSRCAFVIFLVAAFAETNRLPFDLPESETELVGGYHTEYSSMKFALFFMGEYANMIASSAMMVVLFFGGWTLPVFGLDQPAQNVGTGLLAHRDLSGKGARSDGCFYLGALDVAALPV